jgi:hypothetical protein
MKALRSFFKTRSGLEPLLVLVAAVFAADAVSG